MLVFVLSRLRKLKLPDVFGRFCDTIVLKIVWRFFGGFIAFLNMDLFKKRVQMMSFTSENLKKGSLL